MSSDAVACIVCDGQVRQSFSTERLRVSSCRTCGHHTAEHFDHRASGSEYHEQHEAAEHLDSLAQTRHRQAAVIRTLLQEEGIEDSLLDFGCGRGWFLGHLRCAGWGQLAGADTSELAVNGLHDVGLQGLLLNPPNGPEWELPLSQLQFRPRAITLLDVIEHFPPQHARELLTTILSQLAPSLSVVVIKVPLTDGMFYRTSRSLAVAGAAGPLEQLYQCGTWPPHFSYFSVKSATTFLERCGLEILSVTLDPDFEPAGLRERVSVLRKLPAPVSLATGIAIDALGAALRARDSGIFVARPRALAEGDGSLDSAAQGTHVGRTTASLHPNIAQRP